VRLDRHNARVIVSLHVATGAAVGAAARSRRAAAGLGLLAHLAGDRVPHRDIRSPGYELTTGLAGLAVLAATRGPLDRALVGAVAASAPDGEHVLGFLRFRGRKLFPSHRFRGWHRAGGLPAWLQLVAAGALVAALAHPVRRTPQT
jgi:hypothetical protein